MADTFAEAQRRPVYGIWVTVIAAAVGFLLSLIAYFTPHGTIAYSWGALLVLVSTALMLVASLLIALAALPHWFLSLLRVLIVLDILGTGLCAYFLEANVLLFFMAVALVGCIMHVVGDTPRISTN